MISKKIILIAPCLFCLLTGCHQNKKSNSTTLTTPQIISEPTTSMISEQDFESQDYTTLDPNGGLTDSSLADPLSMEETSLSEPDEAGISFNEEGLAFKDGILIVNKKYGVPANYAPGVNPIAQEAVNRLIGDMQQQGLNVGWTTSNFRSYEYQSQLYNGYVSTNGQEAADTFSARPGYSEHQTGLAFDLTDSAGQLITAPIEAQWLLDHAAQYGFIVRYQEGKEAITGYQAEPWHLRYIGARAQEIADSKKTLEEFLEVEGGDYR